MTWILQPFSERKKQVCVCHVPSHTFTTWEHWNLDLLSGGAESSRGKRGMRSSGRRWCQACQERKRSSWCVCSNVCCPLRGVATSERALAGGLRGSPAPTTIAAEPPAQGGIQTLGIFVVHCVVTNWNDMEKNSFYSDLRVTLEGHPVLEAVLPFSTLFSLFLPFSPFFSFFLLFLSFFSIFYIFSFFSLLCFFFSPFFSLFFFFFPFLFFLFVSIFFFF